jgi:predicted cytidylate kinase
MQKTIITISGLPGSGKSSTAKGVAQKLGYKHYSSGDLFRQIGQKHGLSVEETNKSAEQNLKTVDEEIDEALRQAGNDSDLVIDARTAFHWIPESFKVLLKLDPYMAAERTFAHIQSEGRVAQGAESVEQVYQKSQERTASEKKRYAKLYGLDYTDESNFDLVVDTAKHNLSEVIDLILAEYQRRQNL